MAPPLPVIGRRRWPAPPDAPWREAELAVVDLELTGLDAKRDEIISIGVTPVRGGRIAADRYYRTVRPAAEIGPDAAKVHALTVDELASSPPIGELLDEIREQLRGRVIVAHAAFVERAFLDRAFAPVRERLPRDILDTAPLARAAGVAQVGQGVPQLEKLSRDLGLPVHTPHHALGDALTTAQVFLVLAARIEASRTRTLRISELARLTREHAPD